MKKQLFLAILTLSLVSVNCSGNNDDDNGTQQTNPTTDQYFHPPTWIQGSWAVTNGTITNKLFKFTDSDFISLASGTEISRQD